MTTAETTPQPLWDLAALPEATHDVERLTADVDEWGYCFVAEALSPELVAAVQTRFEEQADADDELPMGALA